ncbi:wax ester/triacylglycerol synthase domain-containing protein, partial [Nocardia abscessus]|uniref:wax ester/triacylglycerol synthase domain-containing protein n=1 Tax=Nocardia abscessus TaxID=120957 RepID=UPI0024538F95
MERLTGLDASFLYLETGTQHLHVCALLILDPSSGDYSFEGFKAELARRLPLIPQMRRRVYEVPLNLDHPVWVEDENFDLDYHVRRIAIAAPARPPPKPPHKSAKTSTPKHPPPRRRPGARAGRRELAELVGDIASRPMDRDRPLWEMSVVEGLDDGKVAVVSKYHHAAVDGITGANLMMHLCDPEPGVTKTVPEDEWRPEPKPNDWQMLAEAVVKFPTRAGIVGMLPKTVGVVAGFAQRRRENKAGMAIPFSAPRTPFNLAITPHRAVAFNHPPHDAHKELRAPVGGKGKDRVGTVG